MENIVVIDTETTGLDYTKDKIIEIGAIFLNIPTKTILAQASSLFYAENNDAYAINRIEPNALKKTPKSIESFTKELVIQMFKEADAIVGHNVLFDKRFISTIPDFQEFIKNKKWICTKNDVVWPVRKNTPLNLIHICADLGVPIINAHRALQDCMLLTNALLHLDDIEIFLLKSGCGKILYQAEINFNQRQLVKDYGFCWDNDKKVWFAKLSPKEAKLLPFVVIPVGIMANISKYI